MTMAIATWLLLIGGISAVAGVGLSLFVQSLVSYRRWRRGFPFTKLYLHKAELEEAAVRITSFLTFEEMNGNLDEKLTAYKFDAETLSAIKSFLQARQQEASTVDADYASLFNEIREILTNYETNLQRSPMLRVAL